MASGNHINDKNGCLSKFLDGGIVLLMAAIVKVKQAAAAVRMKICACCGINHEPPNQVEEGGEAAGQPTRPAELKGCGRACPVMSNLGWRWQLLGIGSARGNADDRSESGPSGQLAETGCGGSDRVPELSPEEIKEVV